MITIYQGAWNAVFDLEHKAFVEAYSLDLACLELVLSLATLQKLPVHLKSLKLDQELLDTV